MVRGMLSMLETSINFDGFSCSFALFYIFNMIILCQVFPVDSLRFFFFFGYLLRFIMSLFPRFEEKRLLTM